jgi:hypothetical protein
MPLACGGALLVTVLVAGNVLLAQRRACASSLAAAQEDIEARVTITSKLSNQIKKLESEKDVRGGPRALWHCRRLCLSTQSSIWLPNECVTSAGLPHSNHTPRAHVVSCFATRCSRCATSGTPRRSA